jgi:uncharacterized protein (TIGR04255 family)
VEESVLSTPFGDEPLEEIHLASAPLVRVIAQLRYPQLASMADDTVAHAFAKEVSGDYPLFEEAREVSLMIAGAAISQQEQMTSQVWRLQTADGNWLVTLGRSSLSLEALAYAGRRDFCGRLVQIAGTFIRRAAPPRFDRFGIRYVNRVTNPETIADLSKLVRPEMMGTAALRLPGDVTVHHSLLEAQFNQGAHTTLVRCGVLPAGTTIDLAVPATSLPSWILDIDSAVSGADVVVADKIDDLAADLVERAYRFFRYAVNRDFLKVFEAPQ